MLPYTGEPAGPSVDRALTTGPVRADSCGQPSLAAHSYTRTPRESKHLSNMSLTNVLTLRDKQIGM